MNRFVKRLGERVCKVDKDLVTQVHKNSEDLIEIKQEVEKLMHSAENVVFEIDELERIANETRPSPQ